ncbi:RNA degradosome polyphosphate kinase [Butyrivibrio sp. XB500-5]|uniref:RNA degradosome polyphosphate kinase n=1 Tax=Butyrivibrio sp. XB500-5 TaxID=2364880 RepID=UPI000EA95BAC|nr:RNA degradosome polyphosphate kinase [Butyrivibrio sp. XB500-5]RKM59046.1 RNA degradosome polyphosphate kinase [Butyrivibrio sp. XB500-5]
MAKGGHKKLNEFDFENPKLYINRELSWISFNSRVLSEAEDASNPLFERLKFLSISASNLDEFFMVRVASLKDMINAEYSKLDIAGMTAKQQLDAVLRDLHRFVDHQYNIYNDMLIPLLGKEELYICDPKNLSDNDKDYLSRYFDEFVYPVLTPMAVDSSRPFPLIRNKTLNIGSLLKKKEGKDDVDFATVQVPDVLPRVIELPQEFEDETIRRVVLLEQLIMAYVDKLYLNYDVITSAPYRVERNADLSIDEDEAEDLLKEIEKQIKRRQWGQAIRLEVDKSIDKKLLKFISRELQVDDSEIFSVNGPLDLTFLMKVYKLEGFDELKEHSYKAPQAVPEFDKGEDIFEVISKGDILMHHPYETFENVVKFVENAAVDPNVLAIKQTLYRVSGNSPIIAALAKAADNGKQVTVLVELKARFDEENNIVWAKMLEKAGCHVIYGLVGLKTHCKITLIVRREEDGIKRYVHLATGNYNDSTAKQYTDVGLFTCAPAYGEDATAVFNMLSGYSEPLSWNKLSLAPLWLKDRIIDLIKREEGHALSGEPARIIAKMNSICHKEVIAELYRASCAGVKIDLIVRGICCLKAGIPEISENITVRSIVGNFLEHSRIFYFENGGSPEYYASSADWMPRNLERRVEIMFPVENDKLKAKLWHILDTELKDTEKAHVMNENGVYVKQSAVLPEGSKKINSQKIFGDEASKAVGELNTQNSRVFVPEMNPDNRF